MRKPRDRRVRRLAALLGVTLLLLPALAQEPEGAAPSPQVPTKSPPAPTEPAPREPAAPAPPVPPETVPPETVPPSPKAAVPAVPNPAAPVVKKLRQGALLIHGNYCGVGNRPGKPPIDAIDAACMRHDQCTTTGQLPGCACNDRLRLEAAAIVEDPKTPPDVKAVAAATAASMALLICKVAPREAAPR